LATSSSVTIGATDKVELGDGYSGNVTFVADTGTLQLDHSLSFARTVAGLSGQDTIDLRAALLQTRAHPIKPIPVMSVARCP